MTRVAGVDTGINDMGDSHVHAALLNVSSKRQVEIEVGGRLGERAGGVVQGCGPCAEPAATRAKDGKSGAAALVLRECRDCTEQRGGPCCWHY